jgi:alpha-1,3-rhamnosyl/mannosyltransferase
MSKIRILFDAGVLTRQKTGVGFYVEQLISTVAKNYGEEIEFVGYYFHSIGKTTKPPGIKNVNFLPIRWLPRQVLLGFRLIGFQVPLSVVIPKWRKFDVVLYPNFIGLPTPKSLPSLVIVYDLSFVDHPEYVDNLNARILKKFTPKSIARSNVVITDSQFIKDRIEKKYMIKNSKVRILYPGSVVNIKPYNQRSLKIKPIVYIGTIEPRKNIKNLMLAYSKLPTNLQQKHPLILCGSRGWKNDDIFYTYEKLKNEGVPVEYRGYISEKEKIELYYSASLVAVLSHYEGFGLQILEAMKFNVPILLSDIPVFHEIAKKAAYYCDKDDTNSISQAIINILNNKGKKDKLLLYNKILSNYTWNNTAKEFVDIINNILRRLHVDSH